MGKLTEQSPTSDRRIFVTGANGFIGRALVNRLSQNGLHLRVAVRRPAKPCPSGVESVLVGDLAQDINWRYALESVDVVVHCAARVHVMKEKAADPLAEFRRINVDSTLNLARQAVDAGVRRFIFVSSIGVNGAETFDFPFTAEDRADPHCPYAISKHEAELGLQDIAKEKKLEVAIIRPPLVVGPGAPGNLDILLKSVYKGIPLPLGAIHNKRSLVVLDNLVDLIASCLYHPLAANQVFLVSDGEDLSTAALIRRMAAALGKRARLIPVPLLALQVAARLIGKADLVQSLCGSLQIDIRKTRELLGWMPPVSLDEGLKKTAQHFLAALRSDRC